MLTPIQHRDLTWIAVHTAQTTSGPFATRLSRLALRSLQDLIDEYDRVETFEAYSQAVRWMLGADCVRYIRRRRGDMAAQLADIRAERSRDIHAWTFQHASERQWHG